MQTIAGQTAKLGSEALFHEIAHLVAENRRIHDVRGINLNPASNVMNTKTEAMMASGLGLRASPGSPGDKHEMGLEVICAEVRVASGALANLYLLMATLQAGRHHHRAHARDGR